MKIDKVWNSNMPVDRLVEVLPDDSPLRDALSPAPPPSETGMTAGWHPDTGLEPYLYDTAEFVLMGDLTAGGDSFPSGIVALNGDLYVFGVSVVSTTESALVGNWDPVARIWSAADVSALAADAAFYPVAMGERIYFIFSDASSSTGTGVAFIEGTTVGELQLPVAGPALTTEVNNGLLVITGWFAEGVDIVTYDPTAPQGSEFTEYNLPDNTEVWGGVVGSAGDYTYVWAFSNGWNLYSLNVETGALARVADDKDFLFNEWPTSFAMANGSLNGDLYINVFNSGGAMEILRADDVTGTVTSVLTVSDNGISGDALLELVDETENALWYLNILSDADKIVKISGDGSVQTFDTNADFVYSAQELNGTLYVGASVGGVTALYSLNQADGTLNFVQDLDATNEEVIVSTNGNHLVVWTDRNDDGRWELWASDNPAEADSWTQISPSDVHVDPVFGYGSMLEGDYLV